MTSNDLNKNMILFGLIVGLIFFYIINNYDTVKHIPKPTQQVQTNLIVGTRIIDTPVVSFTDHNFLNVKKFRGPDPRYTVRKPNHVRFVKKPKVYYI